MRWKAERWMKLRHMPVAFGHDRGSSCHTGGRCGPTPSAEARSALLWDLKTRRKYLKGIEQFGRLSGSTSKVWELDAKANEVFTRG
jgi:hypothetical protein